MPKQTNDKTRLYTASRTQTNTTTYNYRNKTEKSSKTTDLSALQDEGVCVVDRKVLHDVGAWRTGHGDDGVKVA